MDRLRVRYRLSIPRYRGTRQVSLEGLQSGFAALGVRDGDRATVRRVGDELVLRKTDAPRSVMWRLPEPRVPI